MEKIIEWLVNAEGRTSLVYNKAADYFQADEEFSAFIRQLAREENVHHTLLAQVYDTIKGRKDLPELIATISDATMKELDESLAGIENGIEAGTLTKSGLADCMVTIELCECNDAFAYILETMKSRFTAFRTAAINIHMHKIAVVRFLNSYDEFKTQLERITHFPDIWKEKILVVDDEQDIIDVMRGILSNDGIIETATNGKRALEKVREKYYAAIISDVNMPVMDGIDFYKSAAELYPSIRRRFMFFTGRLDHETTDFFTAHNIPYLQKPSHLKDIRMMVRDILTATP